MQLTENQAALILEADEDGEINVNVAYADGKNLAGSLCEAIALKLLHDEVLQEELLEMIDMENKE